MADSSESVFDRLSEIAKSLPQREAIATVSKPRWWQFWRLKERRKAKK